MTTLYYLGEPVTVIEDLGDGWVLCKWRDGRVWKHWRAQLVAQDDDKT